jgi:NAD(P)-dependent dehydrogenase (short-subunit alcohol dehydrogenase family)
MLASARRAAPLKRTSVRPNADAVIAVTGCSSGVGFAIAERMAKRNAAVYGGSRRACSPATWAYLPLDVTDRSSVDQFVAEILTREDRIDVLVTSAGMGLAGAVEDTDDDEALRQLDVNFFGTCRAVRAVLPIMRKQGHGKIIIVGSIGGLIGLPFAAYYSASKFALNGFTEALRGETAAYGVQVAIIHPGDLNTEFTRSRLIARRARRGSSYGVAFQRTLGFYAAQEHAAPEPGEVARVVERLVDKRRLPVREVVGSLLERAGVFAKTMLPSRVFEYLMRRAYAPRDQRSR